jgi:hypothetical protein
VCEGCGDCSKKSGCLSVLPVETALGRKRKIDQSSCNKDYSCVEGFCPSFVTVEGGKLKKQSGAAATLDSMPALPAPQIPALHDPFSIMITGVGGTGVVTIGQVLGMAAYLDNKGVTVLDMAGLAQKGGSVWSHVRIANSQQQLHAVRIAAGDANLVLGCDLVVTAAEEAWPKCAKASATPSSTATNPHQRLLKNPDVPQPRHERCGDRIGRCGPLLGGQRHPSGHRADGRCHRQQYVHAGLRLAEGFGAGQRRSADGGHPPEWRGGEIQSAGLYLGPSRRPRSGPGGGTDQPVLGGAVCST